MAYDLWANSSNMPTFHMAGDWPHLLEQCGTYFPFMSKGARWYTVFEERMATHYHDIDDDGEREKVEDKTYPVIICNCGFEVMEEEAKVMARIARNYVAIQRTLDDPREEELNAPITTPDYLKPFPSKIQDAWIDRIERFATWAEQSQGFKVH